MITFFDSTRPFKSARSRSLRRGFLLSASAGWALSFAALPLRAQTRPHSGAQNTSAQKTLRLAQSQEAAGSLALAAASFREALALVPNDATMARELARFYTRQKRTGEALAAWTRLSELRRGDAEAARELSRLRLVLSSAPESEFKGAGVADEAPLPRPEGFMSGTRNVNGVRISRQVPISLLPPVPVTSANALLAQVPASDLPSLPETASAPEPEVAAPAPEIVVPTPGATTLDATPGATTLDATPGATTLDATPGATTPGATTPGATTPSATTPGATMPGATTPTTPDAATPDVTAPTTEAPGSTTIGPEVTAPAVDNGGAPSEALPPTLPPTATSPATGDTVPATSPSNNSTSLPSTPATSSVAPLTAKAVVPVRASVAVTPIAFVAPAPNPVRVSKVQKARAWPYVNRGAALLKQKRTEQALAQYQRAAEIDPANEYALPGVATSQLILGHFDEAASTYRRFLSFNPNNARGLRGLADALTYGRHYPQALGVNNYILNSRDPRNFDAAFQNGQIYTFLKSYGNADVAFSCALSIKPDRADVWVARGESLSYRRDPAAVTSFQKALSLDKNNTRARIGLGNFYLYSGQYGQAVPRLRAVLASQPNNVAALVSLGDALAFSGKSGEAVSPYKRAVGLAPSNIAARVGLGRALVFSGSLNEGAVQLNRVLASDPGNTGALEALALAQSHNAKNPSAAYSTYTHLLQTQHDPASRARILASLGDAQITQNDFPAATRSYAQAVQLAPSNAAFNLTYAQLLFYQTRQEDSLSPALTEPELAQWRATAKAAQNVLALDPKNVQAQAILLQAAVQTKDTATATSLATQLENAVPRTAQESLDLAQALRSAGNSDAATRLLDRAVTQTTDPVLSLRIADATRDTGAYDNATRYYTRLLQLNPSNTAARLGLAKTRLYARDFVGAQEQLRQLNQQSPGNVEAQLLQAQAGLSVGTPESRTEAERIARATLATQPGNAEARRILGDALGTRQRFAEAAQEYRSAIATQPNNAVARLGLARTLNYSRDFEGAIAQYREVIVLTPADPLPRLELAQILLDLSRYTEAEALYRQVLAARRGSALLPTVRRALASNSLERLSPLAWDNSPLRVRSLARLQPKTKTRFAQNVVASGPALPTSPGPNAGDSITITPDASTGAATAPTTGTTTPGQSATDPTPGAATTAPTLATPPVTTLPNITTGIPAATSNAVSDADVADVPPVTATAPVVPGATAGNEARLAAQNDQIVALRGLGELRRRQNRFAEAFGYFRDALRLDSADIPSRVGLAQSLRGLNRPEQAAQEVQNVLANDPVNIPARVLRAQLLADAGRTDEANTQLNAIVASIPPDTALQPSAQLEAFTQIALALNSVGNYTASLNLLNRAVTQYPNEPSIARLRAETFGFAGQTDAGVAAFDALLATDPNDTDALLGKARAFNYANRLPEAETTYRQILANQPTNFIALSELADVLGRRKNFSEAITLYGQAIDQNPTDLSTRINLARLQRSAGQFADAEASLNQVIEADPNNISALSERGSLRGSQGNTAAGLADLQKAISLSPNDPNAQLALAQVQSYGRNYAQSIASYQAFLARNPRNTQARIQLAQVLSYANRSPEALREIGTVLAQTPDDVTAQLARGDILARSNQPGDAIAQYNAILATDPNNVQARTGLADAFLYGRRYNEAVRAYDQLIAAQPGDVSLRIARARALSYAGRSPEAIASLRAIVAADATNIPARLALAEAGANSGNATLQRDAIGEYRQVLGADPNNLNAQLGLARALSYRGQYGESKAIFERILAANPNNNEARLALADTERFAGDPFAAKADLQKLAKTDPAAAAPGLASVRRATSPSIGVNGSYYSDSNGVRLSSVGENAILRTRLLTIGILASQGKFRQTGSAQRNRNTLGLLLARRFGPFQAQLILSRLKYTGVSGKTLYDFALGRDFNTRSRLGLSVARRDIFESELAVASGITADTVSARYTFPLGARLDLETQAAYINYSDNNSRVTVSPSLFFRFRPTNPTLRVGVGYTYDNTRQTRDAPFVYYTPQNFNAASILADYVVAQGPTRFNISGGYPLTTSTGGHGLNRPAATLFGSLERDLSDNFDVFIRGGIVRVPNGSFHSEQVSGGLNLSF